MLLDGEKAVAAYRKLKYVREQYQATILGANMNVLSVNDLVSVVSDMYRIKISLFGVAFDADYTRGMMLRYGDRADIYVRHQLESDWKRFTAVKEVCHVFLDEQEDWSPQGVDTIAHLRNDLALEGVLATPTSQSETLAEIVAIELMYPVECREADKKKLAAGETSETKIALDHRMPEAMISRALGESFDSISAQLWALVEAAQDYLPR